MQIIDEIISKYSNEGLVPLLRSVPKELGQLPYYFHRNEIIHNQKLQRMVESDGKIWRYGDTGQKRQMSLVTQPPEFSESRREIERLEETPADPLFVCELQNATLVGKHAVAFTEDNRLLLNSVRNNHDKLRKAIRTTHIQDRINYLKPSEISTKGCRHLSVAFPMVAEKYSKTREPSNKYYGERSAYYPWIVEYLPKLVGLQIYQEKIGIEPVIVLQPDPPEWMVQSIRAFGFNNKIVTADEGIIKVERLVLNSHRHHNYGGQNMIGESHHPTSARHVFKRLRECFSANLDPSPDRVYVSRQDAPAGRRQVMNDQQLIETVKQYGFKPIKFSEHRFEDQVRIVYNADIILGVHGAGLVNMVFSQNPIIIEILSDSIPVSTYSDMAAILGYEYDYLFAEGVEPNIDPIEQNVKIDTEELTSIIKKHI